MPKPIQPLDKEKLKADLRKALLKTPTDPVEAYYNSVISKAYKVFGGPRPTDQTHAQQILSDDSSLKKAYLVFITNVMANELYNGGFSQYLYNIGAQYLLSISSFLKSIDLHQYVDFVDKVTTIFVHASDAEIELFYKEGFWSGDNGYRNPLADIFDTMGGTSMKSSPSLFDIQPSLHEELFEYVHKFKNEFDTFVNTEAL